MECNKTPAVMGYNVWRVDPSYIFLDLHVAKQQDTSWCSESYPIVAVDCAGGELVSNFKRSKNILRPLNLLERCRASGNPTPSAVYALLYTCFLFPVKGNL